MDYEQQAPEINSARMYSGAGPDPMYAAVSAWNSLAAQVDNTADALADVLRILLEEWTGPTAVRMFQATAPFQLWLIGLAQQIRQTAAQLDGVYQAYRLAFRATVHPQTIAANRLELKKLTAANLLGLHDKEIQDLEEEYLQYWAQDIDVMKAYETTVNLALAALPSWTSAPGVAANAGVVRQASAMTVLSQLLRST
ncbi:PPE family protein [Mycobacterium haemophilum DSM 44634]|uniref:PPE family protein n=1 Tax=Mycobacterium haemophilum TaxID=29311 RepID=UPI0006D3DBD1|nr:PPE family protein [Mycobacterium haemophilum]ALL56201.1 hypothetical protein B586_01625 [Mycobacterium haemophilum DSM 44634]MCV7342582.1 PPE family protein [Mycobacterium haemophilum DSM 44634]